MRTARHIGMIDNAYLVHGIIDARQAQHVECTSFQPTIHQANDMNYPTELLLDRSPNMGVSTRNNITLVAQVLTRAGSQCLPKGSCFQVPQPCMC